MNALRHGLTAPAAALTENEASKVSDLARRFAQISAEQELIEEATALHLQLLRVRSVKIHILDRECGDVELDGNSATEEEALSRALAAAAAELLKIDGYERKALSRRKKAFRLLR